MGKFNQTIVYEKEEEVKAMACRSIKTVFINGREVDFGYLSSLRIAPDMRNGIILGRGYKKCKELHEDRRAPAYLSTIVDGNHNAIKILTSGKSGLPVYHGIGKYIVHAIPFNRRFKCRPPRTEIISGKDVSLKDIIGFLRNHGGKRQFFPAYRENDFQSSYTRGFKKEDFYVAVKGSRIVGTAGAWNQMMYRRNIITGYGGVMRPCRILLNPLLKAAGFYPLPNPGTALNTLTLSFVCVLEDRVEVMKDLVRKIYNTYGNSGFHGMLLGFHEKDPLLGSVKGFVRAPYASRIYMLYWNDGEKFCKEIVDDRVPYLELGSL